MSGEHDDPQGAPPRAPAEATAALDPLEEKVIRMTRGLAAPDDLVLDWQGRGHPDTLAQLRAIELAALQHSGRLAELRREAGVAEAPASERKAEAIAARLRAKAQPAADRAEIVTATAAKSKKKSDPSR